jgi:hypothetical protein
MRYEYESCSALVLELKVIGIRHYDSQLFARGLLYDDLVPIL